MFLYLNLGWEYSSKKTPCPPSKDLEETIKPSSSIILSSLIQNSVFFSYGIEIIESSFPIKY